MCGVTIEQVKELAKKLNVTEDTAKRTLESALKGIREREEKMQYVSSNIYLDWLYNFIEPNKIYDDETALYEMEDGMDKENLLKISYLQKYIENLAEQQNVENALDEKNPFQVLNFIFKYKDKFYQIDTMVGQGGCTFIEMIEDKKVDRKYVQL